MKNILYIANIPKTGKTTFISNIKNKFDLISDVIITDEIIREMMFELSIEISDSDPEKSKTILESAKSGRYDLFIRSTDLNINSFISKLIKQIDNFNNNLIVIEGYVLLVHHEIIISQLKSYYNTVKEIKIDKDQNFRVEYDNKIFDTSNYNYDDLFKSIVLDFVKNNLDQNTLNKINYQCFDNLGFDCKNSESPQKYLASKLESYIKEPHSFLDIGCNNGYFCFKVSSKIKNKIIGIDIVSDPIKVCNVLNEKIFNKKNIEFIHGDILNYEFNEKFDIIYCASTFHYFRESQSFFIDKMNRILNNDGLLFLEVELNPNSGLLKLSRSKNEVPCHFPDEELFLNMIRNKFTVLEKNISSKQKGSPNNRYFYILKKNQ